MANPSAPYDDEHDVHDVHEESQQISPSGQITHADLVKGIDFEEDEFDNDSSGGVRRNRQDYPSQQSRPGPGPKGGSTWDGKSGRVV